MRLETVRLETQPRPVASDVQPAMTMPLTDDKTDVGNYFVSNYPPYSAWSPEGVPALEAAIAGPPAADVPLGLYLHIPFCRKRCKFCYFRVYTDKNSRDIARYLDAIAAEVARYRDEPAVAGRSPEFVYFGGGTPSYISPAQLEQLVGRLRESVGWDTAREVTFECEPGTLTEGKLEAIRGIGVTRLSLGVEHFDDAILEENGRAHRSAEAFRAYEEAASLDFDSINIDLIAGMVGDTTAKWRDAVRKTLDLAPDSVTIYQMEVPYNAIYAKDVTATSSPVADWKTKRAWVDEAFESFLAEGYRISSAYTLVKGDTRFIYRDGLWHGADLLGVGVASFGHLSGVHYQNLDGFDPYCEAVENARRPVHRAYATTPRERGIRELILQIKTGSVAREYFRDKFSLDIVDTYRDWLDKLTERGFARVTDDTVELTREGLLRVDSLLEPFFEPAHRGTRYT